MGKWKSSYSVHPVTPQFVRTEIRNRSPFDFNRHLGWSRRVWMSLRQSRLSSCSCECARRYSYFGKSFGRPPSWSVPTSWPPVCSRTQLHGSPSGRTGHRWSPGRSRQICWVLHCGQRCSRRYAPPGRRPWLQKLRPAHPGGEGALGRAGFQAGSCSMGCQHAAGLRHGVLPDSLPLTPYSLTRTGSQRL